MSRGIFSYYLSDVLSLRSVGLVIGLMFCSLLSNGQMPSQAEYDALIDFYAATNGDEWISNEGWATADPNVVEDVSGWQGIYVNGDGHVEEIWLSGYGLEGTLPSSFGELTHLKWVDLSANQLSGPLPASLGNLQELIWFDLSLNLIEGSLPASLGYLDNLAFVYLSYNNLQGSIPETFGSLQSLSDLDLSHNLLSGSIPISFTNLPGGTSIDLSYNLLEGTIPEVPGSWLNVESNYLSGPLPTSAYMMIDLANNRFTFSDIVWHFDWENNSSISLGAYSPQRPVDVEKEILTTEGGTVALTTTIDINTAPLSRFQWFRTVDGVTTPLNAESETSHTYIIANVSAADTAGRYFYTIKNPVVVFPQLILTSHPQRISLGEDQPPVSGNYVMVSTVLIEGKVDAEDIDNLPVQERSVTYTYFDGLGRPIQRVDWQASPFMHDVVHPIVYDHLGRESRKYLPFTTGNNGGYKPSTTIIDGNGNYIGKAGEFYSALVDPKVQSDERPFSETVFEPSPLNRPLKEYGPGLAWAPSGADKPVGLAYSSNIHNTGNSNTEEAIIAWKIDENGALERATPSIHIETGGYYMSNQLYITIRTDEDGRIVREYTNKSGQTILKKVQAVDLPSNLNNPQHWASTYYIYDDQGRLVFVLQPEGVRAYLNNY